MEPGAIWTDVEAIRRKAPLVHNITNYVVMNTTANALLALGASPVMAHAPEEVEDMIRLVGGVGGALVVNIGTLSEPWVRAMTHAMAEAARRGVPIVLDPVGAGATPYRTQTCRALLAEARPTVIRGNASEIMALLDAEVRTKGVDSAAASDAAADSADRLAVAHGCVVSVSGEIDLITDGAARFKVRNGHPMMTRVTGLGCTASALTGAFVAVNPDPLAAAAHAMAVMGICGEIAAEQAQGPGTLQLYFYDALHNLSEDGIRQRLR
jgi:hydroxyethylthiazole kinase